jgi:hypothetical protein
MKKWILIAMLFAFPAFAAEETWQNVPVIDGMCLSKVKDNPDQHKASCLVQCSKDGVGILTENGYLKLDPEGSKKVLDLIKESGKKDGLRVNVKGSKNGDTITVTSVTLI